MKIRQTLISMIVIIMLVGCAQNIVDYERYDANGKLIFKAHFGQTLVAYYTNKKNLNGMADGERIEFSLDSSIQKSDPNSVNAIVEGIVEGVIQGMTYGH